MIQIDEALLIETFEMLRIRVQPENITKHEIKIIKGLVTALVEQSPEDKVFISYDGEEVPVKFFKKWLESMKDV